MAAALPARPSLEYLRKLAKDRLGAMRDSHAATHGGSTAGTVGGQATLAAAQLAVAREHGFSSWRKLKEYVDAVHNDGDALVAAVRTGDVDAMSRILDRHPELVNATAETTHRELPFDAPAMRLLHVAIADDQPAAARLLLDRGANPNLRNGTGRLPLHDCFELGRDEIEHMLLAAGAVLDVVSAAVLGRHDVLREQLAADPALANERSTNMTPLAWCGYARQAESARILLERGAILDRAPYDFEAIQPAAAVAAAGVLRVLLAHGFDPNWRQTHEDQWRPAAGDTAMHLVIKSRLVDDPTGFVRTLLAAGADPTIRNDAGRTPLDEALARRGTMAENYVTKQPVAAKRLDAVIELLRKVTPATPTPAASVTPTAELFAAARAGEVRHVWELVDSNPALLNARDERGNTLIRVVMADRPANANELVALLLERGIELDVFSAAQLGRVDRVGELLAADPSLATRIDGCCGFTALCWAGRYWGGIDCAPHARCAELLIAAGADVHFRDEELDWTPLHHTAEWWVRTDVAAVLLARGADINARTRDGVTPLGYAVQNKRAGMIEFLKARGGVV